MPTTLDKARRHIAQKKKGRADALHQFSRDSKRLHRAAVRDQRLEKLASARSKREQPLRVCPFPLHVYVLAQFTDKSKLNAPITSKLLFERRAVFRLIGTLSMASSRGNCAATARCAMITTSD
jgi:hypothetical protein